MHVLVKSFFGYILAMLNQVKEMLTVASTIFISGIIYVASGVSSIKFVKGAHGPLCLMVLILSTARMLIISAVSILWYIQQNYWG